MSPPWPRRILASAVVGLLTSCAGSRGPQFISTNTPVTALAHVRVIDGTGGPGADDQTIVIEGQQVRALGPSARVAAPSGARVLDLRGRTVMPGLVGMHEHLFYQYAGSDGGSHAVRAAGAFAKLYLAAGVTTIRTAGTIDLGADVRLKRAVDEGRTPGPHIRITGRYLDASGGSANPDAVARTVAADAEEGATWFKAYTTLRAAELRRAIREAHDRGFRITGHLCAVGFRDAATMGIDNLEHGLPFDTEFYSGKQPDICPNQYAVFEELSRTDVGDPAIHETIRQLVAHGVAVTSTLATIEMYAGREGSFDPRTLGVLTSGLREQVLAAKNAWERPDSRRGWLWSAMLRKEMAFERAFVAAGGRLLAGVDPTGWGGVVAGFGDQRELELLVEARFTPEEAIRIATANGAALLRESEAIGTVAAGQHADLTVVRGNPSARIADVRNVELVFKDGVGYNPAALIAAAQGEVGRFDPWFLVDTPLGKLLAAVAAALLARVIWNRTGARRRGGSARSAIGGEAAS